MAKQFARIGKEIVIAVKAGGPDPTGNPLLRRVVQNARAVNMPKDKVESAIKRAAGKEAESYEEILYEGYAPHGIAVLVETATNNPTRTVSNLRTHFNKGGGNLGNMPLIVCDAVGAAMQVTVLWWAFRLSSPPRTARLG